MVANGVADSFINTALQRRYEASAYARNFLERQIAKTRGDLERRNASWSPMPSSRASSTPAAGTDGKRGGDTDSLQGESLIALNKALADATARRVAAEGAYRQALTTGPTGGGHASTRRCGSSAPRCEAEYQEKRTFMKPDHPEMLSLRSQIDELDRQIAREASQIVVRPQQHACSPNIAPRCRPSRRSRRGSRSSRAHVLNLRGRSIQYNILQREVDTNRSLYDALLQRYKEIGVAGGVGIAPVSIVDRADVPTLPYKPNLLLQPARRPRPGPARRHRGAIGLEFLNDTIKTREDVRKKLGLPASARSRRRPRKDAFVEDLKNPTSIVSEAYSAIVAALRFSTEDGHAQGRLLVTSTRSGEGKSSSALALAQNFARREQIGAADRRRPAQAGVQGRRRQGRPEQAADDRRAGRATISSRPSTRICGCCRAGRFRPTPPTCCRPAESARSSPRLANASTCRSSTGRRRSASPMRRCWPRLPAMCCSSSKAARPAPGRRSRRSNRLEATGTHILGATLTKSTGAGGAYGYGATAMATAMATATARSASKRTEILMIPHGDES